MIQQPTNSENLPAQDIDGGTVLLSVEKTSQGSVAHLTIDHPRRRNAIGPAVIAALTSHATDLEDLPDLRVVTLRGGGGIFSAGANVKVMAGLNPVTARAFITSLHLAIDKVRRLPVPVIAVLSGRCYGAAMELAAACDIRIATDDLICGMPEVRVGIPSVIEACLLPRLIGWGRTSELLLTGRDVVGAENVQIGFAQQMTTPDALEASLGDTMQAILSAAPAAVRAQKSVMRRWETDDSAAIAASIDAFAASFETDEPRRRLTAVTSKSA